MRHFICFIFLLNQLLSGFLFAEDKLFFQLDGKEWKIGSQDISEEDTNIELVPKNETTSDWKELVTLMKFDVPTVTSEKFIEALKTEASNTFPNYDIHFNVINPQLNIVEMSFTPKKAESLESEFGVGRILKKGDLLYYIRYATKNPSIYNQTKEAWIQRLNGLTVADIPPNQEGQWQIFNGNSIYSGNQKWNYEPEIYTIVDKKAGFQIDLPGEWLAKDEWVKLKEIEPYTIALQFQDPSSSLYGIVAFYDREGEQAKFTDPLESSLTESGQPIATQTGDQGQYIISDEEQDRFLMALFEKKSRVYRIEIFAPKDKFNELKEHILQIVRNFHPLDIESEQRKEAI